MRVVDRAYMFKACLNWFACFVCADCDFGDVFVVFEGYELRAYKDVARLVKTDTPYPEF